MTLGQPLCPHCHTNIFVRAEKIFSGRRIIRAYYCGRCDESWHVESQPPEEGVERRQGERRSRLLESEVGGLKPKALSASLASKSENRKAR